MARKKGFWNWIKRNKEGAIIGGVIGGISYYIAMIYILTIAQNNILMWILFLPIKLQLFRHPLWTLILQVLYFTIIGTFIDSIMKPNK